MFEKILGFLGLLDKADIVYENVREPEKKETTKRDYNFSDDEGFPATKKEAAKMAKKNTTKPAKKVAKKEVEDKER